MGWTFTGLTLAAGIAAGLLLDGTGLLEARGEPPTTAARPQEPVAATKAKGRATTTEGAVEPLRHARLSLKVAGRLDEILVEEGQEVRKGDVVAGLERGEQELEVLAAQKALEVAQAQLDEIQAAPRPEQIARAEANLSGAEAKLAEILNGPTAERVRQAEIKVNRAKNNLFYQHTYRDFAPNFHTVSTEMAEAQLGIAYEDLNLARAELDEVKAPTRPEQVAQARAVVETARQDVGLARAPRTRHEIEVARAKVDQARVALEQAQAAAEKAVLVAPLSGTVVEVAPKVGEFVAAGAPIVVLADLSELQVKTTDLEESQASRVTVGQTVRITINAFDDKVLEGRVVSLSSKATVTTAGDANFNATIRLNHQDPALRWGMKTKVDFVP